MRDFQNILIKPHEDIKSGIKRMDQFGQKILFVIDIDFRLLGTVTDGDIRRWILRGGNLGESIESVMNLKPLTLKRGFSFEEARNLMLSKWIEYIPITDEDLRIVSVIRWPELFNKSYQKHELDKVPVIIMAGGKGSRLTPYTRIFPKALVPVGERPIIEHIIEKFEQYGCSDFYISINYKGSMIKSYFSDLSPSYKIYFIEEEKYLGTAGSLFLLRDHFESDFFLSNCDILIDADYSDILAFHRKNSYKLTVVASLKNFIIPYGICKISDGGKLKSIEEKPEYELLINTGFYVVAPEVLSYISENQVLDMTELIERLITQGETVGTYPISEKSWHDIGQVEELERYLSRTGLQ